MEKLEHIPRGTGIQELPQGGETPGPKGLQIRPGSLVNLWSNEEAQVLQRLECCPGLKMPLMGQVGQDQGKE